MIGVVVLSAVQVEIIMKASQTRLKCRWGIIIIIPSHIITVCNRNFQYGMWVNLMSTGNNSQAASCLLKTNIAVLATWGWQVWKKLIFAFAITACPWRRGTAKLVISLSVLWNFCHRSTSGGTKLPHFSPVFSALRYQEWHRGDKGWFLKMINHGWKQTDTISITFSPRWFYLMDYITEVEKKWMMYYKKNLMDCFKTLRYNSSWCKDTKSEYFLYTVYISCRFEGLQVYKNGRTQARLCRLGECSSGISWRCPIGSSVLTAN